MKLTLALVVAASATLAAQTNPLATRPDAVAGGAKIFRQRCSKCHGPDGLGTTKGPDLSAPHVQEKLDAELFSTITSGNSRAGMPSFSNLPELQRWQLVLKLRSLVKAH